MLNLHMFLQNFFSVEFFSLFDLLLLLVWWWIRDCVYCSWWKFSEILQLTCKLLDYLRFLVKLLLNEAVLIFKRLYDLLRHT